jgi:hypothetical protein
MQVGQVLAMTVMFSEHRGFVSVLRKKTKVFQMGSFSVIAGI